MSLVNKYIDSNNFLTAISVYNEEGLSSLAPDGYYENNGIYRGQLSGLLGPSVACESCAPIYSSLSLCFDSVSANELCCGNPTSVTVFVAGAGVTTLASVTGSLYTTSALDVKAAVGFYSDDAGISCSTPPVGTNMRVSACQGGVDWTMENTYNHSVNEIVQYQQGVPGLGVIWCGTVEEIDLSTTPDATVYGAITRECGDTVHCHEI